MLCFVKLWHGNKPTFWNNFSAGLMASMLGAVVVTPADCIKTRIQKKGGITWWNALKEIATEGYMQRGRRGQVQGNGYSIFETWLPKGIYWKS